MANKTIKINVSKNLADEQNMSDSGINLEIKLSKSIIAGMAEANWEHSFTLGYDQVEGVMLLYGGSQWIPFDETPSLPPPTAPLPGAQESPVEPPTEGEPLRNLISTQVSENDPDQSDDEEWLNDIAATLVPIRRPAPAPLVPDRPRTRTALGAKIPEALAPASKSRAETTVDKTPLDNSENVSSSASHSVAVQTLQNHAGGETEEDDWKAKAVDRLLQAAYGDQPHTDSEHPYAPTAPTPITQGSNAGDQRASARSSRKSGGRGGQKKRGRDENTAAGRPSKAKKTKM